MRTPVRLVHGRSPEPLRLRPPVAELKYLYRHSSIKYFAIAETDEKN